MQNSARNGGAIYASSRSVLAILSSLFVNNKVDELGPAVFVEELVNYRYIFGNEGCGHTACDGIYDIASDSCEEFEGQCVAPTPRPTISTGKYCKE